jgi:hypothetical protein
MIFRTSKVVFSDNILEVSEFSSARACSCAVRTCLLGLTFTKMSKWKIKGTLHPRSNVRGHIVILAFGRGQRVDAAEDSSLRWWQPKENTQKLFSLSLTLKGTVA